MVRGLYTAAAGAIVAQANVDVITNNLANVNTSGFKRTLMQIEAAPKTQLFRDQVDPAQTSGTRPKGVATHAAVGELGFGSRIYDTPAAFDQGAIEDTGNPMDLALSGPGFFTVRDAAGTVRYTRGGSFKQSAQNELLTDDGDNVMGADGQPLKVQPGGNGAQPQAQAQAALPEVKLSVDRQGNVSANGAAVGQLAIVEFANTVNLRPEGANKFVNAGPPAQPATKTSVLQGAQEKSNADVVSSMIGLITNERWFDANEKMIQTQDTEVGAAINTIGKSSST